MVPFELSVSFFFALNCLDSSREHNSNHFQRLTALHPPNTSVHSSVISFLNCGPFFFPKDVINLPNSHIVSEWRNVIQGDFVRFFLMNTTMNEFCGISPVILRIWVLAEDRKKWVEEKEIVASTEWWGKWGQTDVRLHLYTPDTNTHRQFCLMVCVFVWFRVYVCVCAWRGEVSCLSVTGCDN